MKRFLSLLATAALTFSVSCGDALNDAGENNGTGEITVTDENSKYIYIQKLYDDSFGKEAYAAATSGIQAWNPDSASLSTSMNDNSNVSKAISADKAFYDAIEGRVNDILNSEIVKAADPNYISTGGMWWNHSDVAADVLLNTMKSSTGNSIIQTTIDSLKIKNAVVNPFVYAETIGKDLFEPFADMLGLGSSVDYTPYFQKICEQLNQISVKLNEIQSNIESLTAIAFTGLMRDDEAPYVAAMTYYTAFTSDLQAKSHSDKFSTIKTYLVDSSEYDEHLLAAFKSAKTRTKDYKGNYTGVTPISQLAPFNVFVSDIIFLHQMSKTRMDLIAMMKKGKELLTYRGVKAKNDLAMVQEMKDGVWIAMQSMDANNKTQCIDAYAYLVAWELMLRAHIAAASLSTEMTLAKDVDASHVKYGYGTFGTLGSYGNILRRTDGKNLVSPTDMVNGKDLSSLFDSNTSGDLSKGKYARIVVNGKNILDMGLTPVYKHFTSSYNSPSANQVCVDPLNGTYILPKPIFWARFESSLTPNIGNIASSNQFDYRSDGLYGTAAGGTFQMHNGSSANVSRTVNITADSAFYKNGVVSLFVKLYGETKVHHKTPYVDSNGYFDGYTEADTYPSWDYGDAILHCNGYVKIGGSGLDLALSHTAPSAIMTGILTINGTTINVGSMGTANAWHHVYIVWSAEGLLSGGNTVRIYVDGVKKYSTNTKFTMTSMRLNYSTDVVATADRYEYDIQSGGHGTEKAYLNMYATSNVTIDNLKIWNHVVSEDPAWMNVLKTKEDALHPIYGSANGYKPNTVEVSYYRNSVLGTE